MVKQGFDNDKYLQTQSAHIRERLASFGGKLYLEFGGKLYDDYHASRVLPGFQPDSKLRMLLQLKEQVEMVIAINAADIEKNKVRGDLGITYDLDVIRLIDIFRGFGLYVSSVVLTRYTPNSQVKAFQSRLESMGVKVYHHFAIEGYPANVAHIVSEDGYGSNPYIEVTKPLVVVNGPGPGSGKLATCLSQLYHENKRGIKARYAKFETFPVWNLPLKHPVNIAYESATIDLRDVNMIDNFHLEHYGELAVNYNRDLESFPVLRRIIEKITGEESEYKSPTDMGVNRVGFAIYDDEAVRFAACQEIIRRYLIARCNYKKGSITEDALERAKLLMDELNLKVNDRDVVQPALDYAEKKRNCDRKYENVIAMAIKMPDGAFVTGRSSRRMVAGAAALLNAIKYLAGLPDELPLISPEILLAMQNLKTNILKKDKATLNCEEVLSALTISAATNPSAKMALDKLTELHGCPAHCTAILSDSDSGIFRDLGIDTTTEPEFSNNNLYES